MAELTPEEAAFIVSLFESSQFASLHLELGDMQLDIERDGAVGSRPRSERASTPVLRDSPGEASGDPDSEAGRGRDDAGPATAVQPPPDARSSADDHASVTITAPMLGVFYRRPQQGDPPFVEVGAEVQESDTVALLEVMKVFTAVPAGVRGTVIEVCAQDGALVEFDQALFRVAVSSSSGAGQYDEDRPARAT